MSGAQRGSLLPLLAGMLLLLGALALAAWPALGGQLRAAALAHARVRAVVAADSALDSAQHWVCKQQPQPPAQSCGAGGGPWRVCAEPLALPSWRTAAALPRAAGVAPLLHIARLSTSPPTYRLSALATVGDARVALQRDVGGCRRLRMRWL